MRKVLALLTIVLILCSNFSILTSKLKADGTTEADILTAIQKAVKLIDSWQKPDGSWPPDYEGEIAKVNPTTTSYSIQAIKAAQSVGVSSTANLREAWGYLKSVQYPEGYWMGEHSYSLADGPGSLRATKDAILGLLALGEPKNSINIQKGVDWLKQKQKPEGYWTVMRVNDHVYTTGEILQGLAVATSPEDPNVRKAVNYLLSMQQADGSIREPPRGEPIAETILSMLALIKSGVSPSSDAIKRAVNYLKTQQDPSGGWRWSDFGKDAVPVPGSTALAIIALLEAKEDPRSENIQKGIKYIIDKQQLEGYWVPSGWPEYRYYVKEITSQCIIALSTYLKLAVPPVAPEFTYDIHSVFDDYSDLRLALEYIFQKGVPFGKIVDCVITITVKDPNQVRSVSVIINGGIHNAEQVSLGVYKVFYYLARNDAAKIIWTMISAVIKLPLPGIVVTVPTPILKQIIIEDINFQKHYHAIDKRLPTIEDAILRLWWWQPRGQYILAASSVDILIIDSKGRKVGAIYENGVFVKEVVEIYGAYYSGRDTVPEFAFIPSTEDVHVSIYGVSKDQYELFVIKEDKGSITFSKSTGKVSIQDEIHEYRVTSTDVELYKKQLLTPSVPFDSLLYGLIAVGTGIAIAGIAIAIAIKRKKP